MAMPLQYENQLFWRAWLFPKCLKMPQNVPFCRDTMGNRHLQNWNILRNDIVWRIGSFPCKDIYLRRNMELSIFTEIIIHLTGFTFLLIECRTRHIQVLDYRSLVTENKPFRYLRNNFATIIRLSVMLTPDIDDRYIHHESITVHPRSKYHSRLPGVTLELRSLLIAL